MGFIKFLLKGKILLGYTNLFSPEKIKRATSNFKIFLVTRL